jgi:hypothetical protein
MDIGRGRVEAKLDLKRFVFTNRPDKLRFQLGKRNDLRRAARDALKLLIYIEGHGS